MEKSAIDFQRGSTPSFIPILVFHANDLIAMTCWNADVRRSVTRGRCATPPVALPHLRTAAASATAPPSASLPSPAHSHCGSGSEARRGGGQSWSGSTGDVTGTARGRPRSAPGRGRRASTACAAVGSGFAAADHAAATAARCGPGGSDGSRVVATVGGSSRRRARHATTRRSPPSRQKKARPAAASLATMHSDRGRIPSGGPAGRLGRPGSARPETGGGGHAGWPCQSQPRCDRATATPRPPRQARQ